MLFVDFYISTELEVDSRGEDNFCEVKAYFYRGHYEDRLTEITNVNENVYVRDERWREVTITFLPKIQRRSELMQNLYDMLIESKRTNEEVIPGCVF